MPELSTLMAVAGGGALGAVSRYAVYLGTERMFEEPFLAGTLTVNVVGSFLLGLAVAYFVGRPVSDTTRAFVTVGLLGAFTTFSTFSFETVALVHDAQYSRAAAYVIGSVTLGFLALVAGAALGGSGGTAALGG